MEGTTLGKYRVGRRLGAGGMGVVYVGEHELLGNQVAVKVINPELARSEGSVTRFLNEAVSAARIKHAGIVQIFDYGADATSGSAYFVMELLDGESLAERLARVGWLDTAHALRLVAQIADTLRAAHAAGIIHRDLKPDNVFLVPDPLVPGGERIKLLDFGIAKLFGDGLGGGASATRTGDVLGTPYYMSPEQCRGAGLVDHRADIYSLGCVLFRLVCGRVPFPGEGVGEILAAHIHVAPPAPRSLRPDIPEALEQLILQMLAKSPDERLQSMTAVLGAVAAVAEVCGIDGATPSGQVWVADARSSELAQTAVGAAASVGELAYAATARVAGGPVSEEAAATLAGPSEAAATMAASGGAASAEDMSQEASSSASPRRSLARGLALGLSA
ncbi:MAG: serine/threonine protein kinase, partial [Myxococcales bacterium]|nr:serine/threonine protein kinase [Myxococcales bacterium]